jgi:hypothetical protein
MDRADDPLECQAQSFQQRVTSKFSRTQPSLGDDTKRY